MKMMGGIRLEGGMLENWYIFPGFSLERFVEKNVLICSSFHVCRSFSITY